MSDYFEEMGRALRGESEAPNHLMQVARFLRDSGMLALLEDMEMLPPPASKAAVKDLQVTEIKEKKQQCPVCIRDFDVGALAKTLPCGHSFHEECIIPWLAKTNSCPVCRFELPTDNEDYEDCKKEKKRALQREKDIESLHNSMFT